MLSRDTYNVKIVGVDEYKSCEGENMTYATEEVSGMVLKCQGTKAITDSDLNSLSYIYRMFPYSLMMLHSSLYGIKSYYGYYVRESISYSAEYYREKDEKSECEKKLTEPYLESDENEILYYSSEKMCKGKSSCISAPYIKESELEEEILLDILNRVENVGETVIIIGGTFSVSETFMNYGDEDPTKNGFYIVLTIRGEIVVIGEKGLELLFGMGKNLTELIREKRTIESANSPFNEIYGKLSNDQINFDGKK